MIAAETAITCDPPAPSPRELYPQLIYSLDGWDYVAWWMCEWDRAHPVEKTPLGVRLAAWLSWGWPLWIGAVLVLAAALMGDNPAQRAFSFLAVFAVLVAFLTARRGTASAAAGWQWARDKHHLRMKDKALAEQAAGRTMNRRRFHWLLLFPDCFQEVTELRRTAPGGVEDYQFQVATVPWELVRAIVVEEQHVFLIGPGKDAWIIPRRCFAPVAAVADFLDVVYSCRRAATHARVGTFAPLVKNPEAIQVGQPAR